MYKFLVLLLGISQQGSIEDAIVIDTASSQEPVELERFFEEDRPSITDVPRGFRIIALSNLAEYYASLLKQGHLPKERSCTRAQDLIMLALSRRVSPYKTTGLRLPSRLAGHVLYLTHLNIILGAQERICRHGAHFKLNRRVSQYLAGQSQNRWAHARSYPGRSQRWPADQAALLFSLWLFDHNYGGSGSVSEEPIRRWLEYVSGPGMSRVYDLPVSEVTGATKTSAIPRGCALSFMVRYMAAFAPHRAKTQWEKYTKDFTVNVFILRGLREWPPGYDGPIDADSGPIIMGVGAAATGLGMGAAQSVGDAITHARLLRTMHLVNGLIGANHKSAYRTAVAWKNHHVQIGTKPDPLGGGNQGQLQKTGLSILARSIALFGQYGTRWYM